MGKESSDEEEFDDAPDDDQYDTEDSFIDDTELDEYFQVDKLSTKHNGYFVNRGKLEWIESSSSPNLSTKKRRKKDSAAVPSEVDREHARKEHANIGHMKIKSAARNAPLVAKKLAPVKVATSFGEHYQERKLRKTKTNASTGIYDKRTADFAINLDVLPSARILNKDISSVKKETKDFGKNRSLFSKGLFKSSVTSESCDATYRASQEKAAASQVEPQPKKLFDGENEIEALPKIWWKDRYVSGECPQINSSMNLYPTPTEQCLSHRVREGSIRPKGTTLELAIHDMEKIVASCRSPNPVIQEVDPSAQGVKKRLPRDVKHELAKVARLSASQSKISEEELINRLMGFLGHLVQRKTLKRNMREMVELGLSVKQQKADKFQHIKKVLEMI